MIKWHRISAMGDLVLEHIAMRDGKQVGRIARYYRPPTTQRHLRTAPTVATYDYLGRAFPTLRQAKAEAERHLTTQ